MIKFLQIANLVLGLIPPIITSLIYIKSGLIKLFKKSKDSIIKAVPKAKKQKIDKKAEPNDKKQ